MSHFFQNVTLSDVVLRVRDRERVQAFYRDVLGFEVAFDEGPQTGLSPAGRSPALVVLEHAPEAAPAPAGAAGLFHVAFLYPDRQALGRALRHVLDAGQMPGSADHGVSEALYLNDPEGNGVELYADRPVEAWPPARPDGQVAMYTDALDLHALVAEGEAPGPLLPAATRIGHIHLRVSDLERAEAFYSGVLGFDVRQRDYPGARFMGRDGYHHHFGANVWRSRRPAVAGSLGLASFAVRFRRAEIVDEVLALAEARGIAPREAAAGRTLRDFDGLDVVVGLDDG